MDCNNDQFAFLMSSLMKELNNPSPGDTDSQVEEDNPMMKMLNITSSLINKSSDLVTNLKETMLLSEDLKILLVFTLSILTNKEDAVLFGTSIKGLVQSEEQFPEIFQKSKYYTDIVEGYKSHSNM